MVVIRYDGQAVLIGQGIRAEVITQGDCPVLLEVDVPEGVEVRCEEARHSGLCSRSREHKDGDSETDEFGIN